jgi:sporulation protein YhbH
VSRDESSYTISQEDWSLHKKGNDDQVRHRKRVEDAIKQNLSDLITEESIVLSNGKDVIKIPVRSLDEYKIRYNHEKTKHVGQGDGDSKIGDVVSAGSPSPVPGKIGEKAGDQPGVDYYETEVSMEELEEALFKELELPNLEKKDEHNIELEDIEFNDIRSTGLMGNIEKKRTMLAAYKRNAMSGNPQFHPIYPEDIKFRTWNEIVKPESKAVVLAMMDTSGSMGLFEKYVARSFFFWMTRFLRTKYEKVEIEFIAHHTEAKVVSEEDFFAKGESGGTICSSVYAKALELIDLKYQPSQYNIYPIHFSDGDNLSSDNSKCEKLIKQLLDQSSMFGYGEVNQYSRRSTLMNLYREIEHEKLRYSVLRKKTDVYETLKSFFQKNDS